MHLMKKNTKSVAEIINRQVSEYDMRQTVVAGVEIQPAVLKPVITVARELGSCGEEVASGVAQELNCELIGAEIFDKIARAADVRKQLIDSMDQQTWSKMDAWITAMISGKLFGFDDYARYLLEAVHALSHLGPVVMLGRGAGFVPRSRPRLDVRVIAPLEHRIERVAKQEGCTSDEAKKKITETDARRNKFIKQVFGRDWTDPDEYDLVINTAHLPIQIAVNLITQTWMSYSAIKG